MSEDKIVKYRNMRARRERIWIYSPEDAYENKIAWGLKTIKLEYEHKFSFQEDGLAFEYIMFSHGNKVFRVPVAVIQALQGE